MAAWVASRDADNLGGSAAMRSTSTESLNGCWLCCCVSRPSGRGGISWNSPCGRGRGDPSGQHQAGIEPEPSYRRVSAERARGVRKSAYPQITGVRRRADRFAWGGSIKRALKHRACCAFRRPVFNPARIGGGRYDAASAEAARSEPYLNRHDNLSSHVLATSCSSAIPESECRRSNGRGGGARRLVTNEE
jgi:hypothetical protein